MAAAACQQAITPGACTLVAVDAVSVTVLDASTKARVCDASVLAIDGDFRSDLRVSGGADACVHSGPTERPGRYEVRASRSGYETGVLSDVRVAASECHVIPVTVVLELERAGQR